MPIVGGLDIHRKQITFDYLDTMTGQVCRGQVSPADRVHLRACLARFAEGVNHMAVCRPGTWPRSASWPIPAGEAVVSPWPQAARQDRQGRLAAMSGRLVGMSKPSDMP